MAAPMKACQILTLSARVRSCLSVRCMSNIRRDGPPPWAAGHVPSGKTFFAIQLTRIQNKELWKKRMEKVNQPWRQVLLDYNKRKAMLAERPPEDPPKLLMVKLVKNLKGVPQKQKDIIELLFGIKEKGKPYIIRNREYEVDLLKKVNYLIQVFPVTYPYGLPESEADYEHCYIRDNGEFIVRKRLDPVQHIEETKLITTEEKPEDVFQIKQELIDKTLEQKKVSYQIHQEYYQTQYFYERNQDKKEMRYKGNTNIGYDKIWH